MDGAVGDVPEKTMDLTKIAKTIKLRLLALVNDIFDMKKIEAGQLAYAFEPIDLSDLLPKAIKANEAYGLILESILLTRANRAKFLGERR